MVVRFVQTSLPFSSGEAKFNTQTMQPATALVLTILIAVVLQCQSRTLFALMLDSVHDLLYTELFDPDTGRNGRISEIKPFMQRYSSSAVGNGTVYYLYTHANYPQQVDFVSVEKMQITGSFRIEGTNNTNRMSAMHYDPDLGIIGAFPTLNTIARVNTTGSVLPLASFPMRESDAIAESAYDPTNKRLFLLIARTEGYFIFTIDIRKGTVSSAKLPSPIIKMDQMVYDDYSGLLLGWYLNKLSVLNSYSGDIKSYGDIVVPSGGYAVYNLFCIDNVGHQYYQVIKQGDNLSLYKISTVDATLQSFSFNGKSVYMVDFTP